MTFLNLHIMINANTDILRDNVLDLVYREVVGPDPSSDKDLNQENGEEILINYNPRSRYGAGILFPQNCTNQEIDIDEDNHDSSTSNEVNIGFEFSQGEEKTKQKKSNYENVASDNNDPISNANSLKPSAMGFSCIVDNNLNQLEVEIKTAIYRKKENHLCKKCNNMGSSIGGLYYDGDQKKLLQCVDCSGTGLINREKCTNCAGIGETEDKTCSKCYGSGEIGSYCNQKCRKCNYCKGKKYVFYRLPLNSSINSDYSFNIDLAQEMNKNHIYKNILKIPNEPENAGLTFSIRKRMAKHIKKSQSFITCTLLNNNLSSISSTGRISIKDEDCFFQTQISIKTIGQFYPLPYGKGIHNDDDKKQNELLYRNKPTYAIGHGFSVNWSEEQEVNQINTDAIPYYYMNKIDPQQSDRFSALDLSFYNMGSSDNFNSSLLSMDELCNRYEKWIDEMKTGSSALDTEYRETAYKNIDACLKSLNRMREGLEVIRNNNSARDAFILMNRSIYIQHINSKLELKKWIYNSNNNSWEIPEKQSLEYNYDDPETYKQTCDYIPSWYPFQLSFILLNIKSIVEKSSDDRDIVECLWFPTGGGKTEAYLGLIAFSIFFRRLESNGLNIGVTAVMRYTLRLLTSQQFSRASSLICACEYLRQTSEYSERLGEEKISIGLWIGGASTPNKLDGGKKNLNQLTDSYHRKITKNELVVLKCPWCASQMGVVEDEKLKKSECIGYTEIRIKKVASRRQFNTIGYVCNNPACFFTEKTNPLPLHVIDEAIYNTKPTLLISTVDKFAALPWNPSPNSISLFKETEVNSAPDLLIQDELHLISGPLGSIVGIYETSIKYLFSTTVEGKRIFPKIIASTATVTRASDQINALYNLNYDKERYKSDYVGLFPHPCINYNDSFFGREIEDRDNARLYVGLNTSGYSDPKTSQTRLISAMLQAAKDLKVEKLIERDPYWTLLIYFNSIRELGGASTLIEQDVKAYLKILQSRKYPNIIYDKNYDLLRSDNFIKRELAARQATDISEELKKLEVKYSSKDSKPIDICLATNMISVGVDISRLGIMMVVGQPKTTSEYIQATSRVGRSKPGIIFTWYNSSRPRDKSHYEQFASYHSRIYSMVEPTSVTAFSEPVRERALHAQIIILARFLGIDTPSRLPESSVLEEIKTIIMNRVRSVNREEVESTETMFNKIISKWNNMTATDWGGMSGYNRNPDNPEDQVLLFPFGKNAQAKDYKVFKTLTSMRHVDSECEGAIVFDYE